MMKRFIITDIDRKTQQNMNTGPKSGSNWIVSIKALEISSPNIIEKSEK
jgi:hypothetical protein